MARLLVRDRYTREFEIDESALPFWQDVEVLGRIPDVGDEPELTQSPPEESGATKHSKAASRSAQNKEE